MASPALRTYTLFLAAAAFLLVVAGGLVTSTGSALSVPDWPLSFGQIFPPMVGGVLYEHGHRMVGAAVGLLTIVLAPWLQFRAKEPLLKTAGWIALGLVCVQGILGGATVLLKLPATTSVAHACLGQIFFAWMCCIAAMAWSRPGSGSEFTHWVRQGSSHETNLALTPAVGKLRRLALLTTGFVFLQLFFGAIYRHTGLMLHAHFLGAALVTIHGVLLFKRVAASRLQDVWLTRLAPLLMGLIVAQLCLGFWTWRRPSVFDATAHVAVGALILATSVVLSLQSFRRMAA